jgi:threonine dehydrogenase-like Zn-dependent dehydrogenase
VVLGRDGQPELADAREPSGPGELVHVRACGLCGSDVEKLGVGPAGAVLGHEVEGELADGSRVAVAHRVACGTCARCAAGHESTCVEFATLRLEPGGFAERLRATHVIPLPEALGPLDGIWVEPLACVLRAADRVGEGRVLVVGCGAIGLLWIQVLLLSGHEVVAADPRPDRLAGALEVGAPVDEGPVETAVVTSAAGLNAALERVSPGGAVLVFSAPSGLVATSLDAVYRKELTVTGSRSASLEQFHAALDLLPTLALPPVVTLPLDRFTEGVDLYRSGSALKVVFTP